MNYYDRYIKYKKKYLLTRNTLVILKLLLSFDDINKIISPILMNENFNIDNCIRDAHIFCLLPKNINKKDCEIYLKIIKNSYDNLIKYPNKFNKLKTKNNNIKNYSIIISIINYCLMNYKPSYIVNPISIKLSEPIKFINLYTKNNYVFVNIKSISV